MESNDSTVSMGNPLAAVSASSGCDDDGLFLRLRALCHD